MLPAKTTDATALRWRKSSHSMSNGDCAELAVLRLPRPGDLITACGLAAVVTRLRGPVRDPDNGGRAGLAIDWEAAEPPAGHRILGTSVRSWP